MSQSSTNTEPAEQTTSSVLTKLLNVFVSPGLVFEEVAATPPKAVNWIVPAALVSLSSLLTLGVTIGPDGVSTAVNQLLDAGTITQPQAASMNGQWGSVSRLAILLAPFAAAIWSAFVLWLIGNVFLRTRLGFRKALEVATLSGTILILGSVMTWLLVAATGNPLARPALSLLCFNLPQASLLRTTGGLLDFLHLWATAVLAVGLSKLAGVTFKESAFWVFGYWFVTRAALMLLA